MSHPNTDTFIRDLRGASSARRRFRRGTITKTYSVTDLRRSAAHRYSPAEVIAVEREVVNGVPAQISTSYVERSH